MNPWFVSQNCCVFVVNSPVTHTDAVKTAPLASPRTLRTRSGGGRCSCVTALPHSFSLAWSTDWPGPRPAALSPRDRRLVIKLCVRDGERISAGPPGLTSAATKMVGAVPPWRGPGTNQDGTLHRTLRTHKHLCCSIISVRTRITIDSWVAQLERNVPHVAGQWVGVRNSAFTLTRELKLTTLSVLKINTYFISHESISEVGSHRRGSFYISYE